MDFDGIEINNEQDWIDYKNKYLKRDRNYKGVIGTLYQHKGYSDNYHFYLDLDDIVFAININGFNEWAYEDFLEWCTDYLNYAELNEKPSDYNITQKIIDEYNHTKTLTGIPERYDKNSGIGLFRVFADWEEDNFSWLIDRYVDFIKDLYDDISIIFDENGDIIY